MKYRSIETGIFDILTALCSPLSIIEYTPLLYKLSTWPTKYKIMQRCGYLKRCIMTGRSEIGHIQMRSILLTTPILWVSTKNRVSDRLITKKCLFYCTILTTCLPYSGILLPEALEINFLIGDLNFYCIFSLILIKRKS